MSGGKRQYAKHGPYSIISPVLAGKLHVIDILVPEVALKCKVGIFDDVGLD